MYDLGVGMAMAALGGGSGLGVGPGGSISGCWGSMGWGGPGAAFTVNNTVARQVQLVQEQKIRGAILRLHFRCTVWNNEGVIGCNLNRLPFTVKTKKIIVNLNTQHFGLGKINKKTNLTTTLVQEKIMQMFLKKIQYMTKCNDMHSLLKKRLIYYTKNIKESPLLT